MVWRIELDPAAVKELGRLDKPIAQRITRFLRERVAPLDDPRAIGEALRGDALGHYWKYRIGDHRVVAQMVDRRVVIVVVRVGHRSDVYRDA